MIISVEDTAVKRVDSCSSTELKMPVAAVSPVSEKSIGPNATDVRSASDKQLSTAESVNTFKSKMSANDVMMSPRDKTRNLCPSKSGAGGEARFGSKGSSNIASVMPQSVRSVLSGSSAGESSSCSEGVCDSGSGERSRATSDSLRAATEESGRSETSGNNSQTSSNTRSTLPGSGPYYHQLPYPMAPGHYNPYAQHIPHFAYAAGGYSPYAYPAQVPHYPMSPMGHYPYGPVPGPIPSPATGFGTPGMGSTEHSPQFGVHGHPHFYPNTAHPAYTMPHAMYGHGFFPPQMGMHASPDSGVHRQSSNQSADVSNRSGSNHSQQRAQPLASQGHQLLNTALGGAPALPRELVRLNEERDRADSAESSVSLRLSMYAQNSNRGDAVPPQTEPHIQPRMPSVHAGSQHRSSAGSERRSSAAASSNKSGNPASSGHPSAVTGSSGPTLSNFSSASVTSSGVGASRESQIEEPQEEERSCGSPHVSVNEGDVSVSVPATKSMVMASSSYKYTLKDDEIKLNLEGSHETGYNSDMLRSRASSGVDVPKQPASLSSDGKSSVYQSANE